MARNRQKPPRPPKPDDRPSVPRFKSRKAAQAPGLKAILSAVGSLTSQKPAPEHYDEYKRQTETIKHHRGSAILLATGVENALQQAITRNYSIDEDLQAELFGSTQRALGSFHAKTIAAQALRVIGPETRRNLDIIRTIRNAFAHAMIPVSFATPEIAAACAAIITPAEWYGGWIRSARAERYSGRLRFKYACQTITHSLMTHTFSGPQGYTAQSIASKGIPVCEHYEVWARREPLQ